MMIKAFYVMMAALLAAPSCAEVHESARPSVDSTEHGAPNAGVTVTLDVILKPEKVQTVLAAIPASLKDTASRPGFRSIRVVRHRDAANRLLLLEKWDSVEAYQAYVAWRAVHGSVLKENALSVQANLWPTLIVEK